MGCTYCTVITGMAVMLQLARHYMPLKMTEPYCTPRNNVSTAAAALPIKYKAVHPTVAGLHQPNNTDSCLEVSAQPSSVLASLKAAHRAISDRVAGTVDHKA